MGFRHHQRVAFLGCEFEFIEMVNDNQALIRNKTKLRQPDLVVNVSKLSPYCERPQGRY